MNARDYEQLMLDACKQIAAGSISVPESEELANVVNVAAMLSDYADALVSRRLHDAAARYFKDHPEHHHSTQEVLRRGWIISMPRFRAMLEKQVYNA